MMSKNKILFSDFITIDGEVSFTYTETNSEGENLSSNRIYFNLFPAIKPRPDLIALAISTLCAKTYSSIHFDTNVSESIIDAISKFTSAVVTASFSFDNSYQRKIRNNVTLNFSGGFDSLAAKCLMPENTNLVSMDFGGRFSRERRFFENFDTCIVSTNLLETPLKSNSWSMMGIASILYSDYLATDFHTFGSIFEVSPNNFTDYPVAARNNSFPPFLAAGMENAPYVLGLTEVGTLKVIGHYEPDLIAPSLDSLADPVEEKRYRKQVLSLIASEKAKRDYNLTIIDTPPRPHFKFGQNLSADFLSLYIIKHAGLDIASHTIMDIPDEVVKAADNLSLLFYERLNTNFIENFPKELVGGLLSNLGNAGVIPFTPDDWKEYYQVRELMSKYHELK
ncbi:hypothetical protein ACN6MT_06075 [Neobacillus niacini]|uniref:hypothetical protein n=1 Tax=Neobacillus niacini TaxID=86668 RepID=UPI003B01DBEE